MTELTTRQHLEHVVDQVALAIAHDTDDQVRSLVPTMRTSLRDLFSKYDIGTDAKDLSELMIGNIIATREAIRLGAGQISRTLH